MTDILDDVPILLNCPADDCPGEIRTTFGKLKANPEVTCPVCRAKANAELGEEDLQAARDALAGLGKGKGASEDGGI